MLNWLSRFNICCFLDDHQYGHHPHVHDCIAGAGTASVIQTRYPALEALEDYARGVDDWLFGHLGYDLKNEIEGLQTAGPDRIGFSPLFFFVPQYVVMVSEGHIQIGSLQQDHEQVFHDISTTDAQLTPSSPVQVKQRLTRRDYLDILARIREHIHRGDCYEINFCQEFYAEDAHIDPLHIYRELSALSPNPFSVFYRNNERFLMCASPERFLAREGNKLISQPIKGTIARDPVDPEADGILKRQLSQSMKDRTENVMVVDLVRNDLSRVCREGTVKVDELFGVYAFPQVYQMISTVSGELKADTSIADIIRACFPMGSMTGAPKRRVMQLIEQYEGVARGIFSGSVGYIKPSGDFDFNVVIRSIMYNREDKYLSFMTGSGITASSDAEKEYEECMLKAKAMRNVISLLV